MDLDFSLEVTGFEIGEIDLRIEQLSSSNEECNARADRLPEPVSGPSVTRPGDLWLLNEHRVLCASALEQTAYASLMKNSRATMVFTDPPFNVRIGGNVSGSGAIQHREFAMASGELSEDEFRRFLSKACSLLARYSVPEALHYVCMDWRHMGELLAAGREVYSELKNVCVWVKDNAGMGSLYRSQHELVSVFKRGRRSHRNNVQLGQYGRNRTNVWNYPCANSFSRSGEEGNLLALHPTVKPAALVADAIMDCTDRRDVVLDAFLGSGTTVIAAERTGRRCYGLELDPSYVDVIVRRWQAYTRQTAQHAETGRRSQRQRLRWQDGILRRRPLVRERRGVRGRLPQTSQAFAVQEGPIRQSARKVARHEELRDLLKQALLASVLVKQNGHETKTTKLRVMVIRLIHQAMKGHYRQFACCSDPRGWTVY